MLCVTGLRTSVVRELCRLTGDEPVRIDADLSDPGAILNIPKCDRYLLAAGLLYGKRTLELSGSEIMAALAVNLVNVIRICETILTRDIAPRICVVGSESGYVGSFEEIYAAAKAGVHAYVMQRATKWPQQLFAVSPPIISDAGMTMCRADYPGILSERWHVTTAQVARLIRRHLYDRDAFPLTGGVVRMLQEDG